MYLFQSKVEGNSSQKACAIRGRSIRFLGEGAGCSAFFAWRVRCFRATGNDRDAKEATNTAFNFLKANGNRISGAISTTTKDYIINYQDLQGIGMTGKLALPTLVAICSIALGKPTLSSLTVLGEISISGTMMKVDELANSLQVCLDSGAKRVLLPITSVAELGTVPADLIGSFNLIFYSSAEDAVFKALGVE